jgi:small subunit ribosomal protein S8
MYYDLLVRIKNAGLAKHETLQVPFTKFDFAVARLLVDAGYLDDAQKKAVGKRNVIELRLRYKNKAPVLADFRIMSKPSRRLYRGYHKLHPVKQHFGIAVLSTPAGVLTNRDARKRKVGGEYLFEVW